MVLSIVLLMIEYLAVLHGRDRAALRGVRTQALKEGRMFGGL